MQKKKDKNLMKTDVKPMKEGLLSRIFHLYYDGFRTMTLGKTLWAVILIKLAIIFLVFKLFFFPDILEENYPDDEARAQAVRTALTGR